MNTKLLTTALVLLMGLSTVRGQTKSPSSEMQKDSIYYTCSMHPDVRSDKPGKCPKCGMTLEKKTDALKTQTNDGLMESMNRMMNKMNVMKMTGDFDLDFANMMIMHHQAAIDMSLLEIANGADLKIKGMANTIVTAQRKEVEQLQSFIDNHKTRVTEMKSAKTHDELTAAMRAMMDSMKKMKMTGDTDKDFVMMMVPHHEGAIKMAKAERSHGKHADVKKMAEGMIDGQSKEIDQFKAWLSGKM